MRRYTISVNNTSKVVDVEAVGANLFRVQIDGRLVDVTLDDHRDLAHSAITPAVTARAVAAAPGAPAASAPMASDAPAPAATAPTQGAAPTAPGGAPRAAAAAGGGGRDKMTAPWYRDFAAAELPRFTTEAGVEAVVIAGASHGVSGAVTRETTAPLYLDLHLPAGASFSQPLPAGHNAFVYVYRGALTLGAETVPVRTMAILANDADSDGVRIEATTDTRALLIAGRPLGEPIAQYGPFVMNTEQEIYQAVADYRAGRLAA